MSGAPFLALLAVLALAGCARTIPPPRTAPPVPAPRPVPVPRPLPVPQPVPVPVPPAPAGETALQAGVRAGPPRLAFDPEQAARAYAAFRISCPALLRRSDASGLTRPEDWRAACGQAPADPSPAGLAAFFEREFELVQVGDGAAFATGYYEPEIPGSRTRQAGYETPVYARPPDLLDANPRTGSGGRGRVDASGNYVRYHDRTAIEQGVLAGRGLEIAWAADPVDLFFLQIQGSGRLRLPDGSVMRIGYASQNGHGYVPIGRLLRERGIVAPPVTMQKIVEWLHANPEAGRALMRENPSYVFFRELTGAGPLGALGLPVTAYGSVATDPKFVPLGAPILMFDMDNPRANGLWVAQDTGGAIRGSNRFDTFWGAGPEAAAIAGGMAARGRAWILLPRGAIERIRARAAPAQR
ncbi:MAG: rane-bound lytic murein transglycosylase [Sphingomonadales bacterium]|jgi:membrane-bound lytic murein transglycosylase A|nr:rane-bound lytic murein transglycosylase [Sphingomonadales bacterium]